MLRALRRFSSDFWAFFVVFPFPRFLPDIGCRCAGRLVSHLLRREGVHRARVELVFGDVELALELALDVEVHGEKRDLGGSTLP